MTSIVRFSFALLGLLVVSSAFGKAQNVTCKNVRDWVSTASSMSTAGMSVRVVRNPLSMGFIDEIFQRYFGVTYADLTERDKRRFEETINSCKAILRQRWNLSIPFWKDTRTIDYLIWQKLIAEVNSDGSTEEPASNKKRADGLESSKKNNERVSGSEPSPRIQRHQEHSSEPFVRRGEIPINPQRAGKLIYQRNGLDIHLGDTLNGNASCHLGTKNGEHGGRFSMIAIRDVSINDVTTEDWLWNDLRPIARELMVENCPGADLADVGVYIRGVDITYDGYPYEISKGEVFYLELGKGTYRYKSVDGTERFFKFIPTVGVANVYFGFIDLMSPTKRERILRELESGDRPRDLGPNNRLSYFGNDIEYVSTYTFWGADGTYSGLVTKLRENKFRRDREAAARKRDMQLMRNAIRFAASLGAVIDISHCASAHYERSPMPVYCNNYEFWW